MATQNHCRVDMTFQVGDHVMLRKELLGAAGSGKLRPRRARSLLLRLLPTHTRRPARREVQQDRRRRRARAYFPRADRSPPRPAQRSRPPLPILAQTRSIFRFRAAAVASLFPSESKSLATMARILPGNLEPVNGVTMTGPIFSKTGVVATCLFKLAQCHDPYTPSQDGHVPVPGHV